MNRAGDLNGRTAIGNAVHDFLRGERRGWRDAGQLFERVRAPHAERIVGGATGVGLPEVRHTD